MKIISKTYFLFLEVPHRKISLSMLKQVGLIAKKVKSFFTVPHARAPQSTLFIRSVFEHFASEEVGFLFLSSK